MGNITSKEVLTHKLFPVENMEGIAYCSVCGGTEGTLPTDCPGFTLNNFIQEAIYKGGLDFYQGHWSVRKPN